VAKLWSGNWAYGSFFRGANQCYLLGSIKQSTKHGTLRANSAKTGSNRNIKNWGANKNVVNCQEKREEANPYFWGTLKGERRGKPCGQFAYISYLILHFLALAPQPSRRIFYYFPYFYLHSWNRPKSPDSNSSLSRTWSRFVKYFRLAQNVFNILFSLPGSEQFREIFWLPNMAAGSMAFAYE